MRLAGIAALNVTPHFPGLGCWGATEQKTGINQSPKRQTPQPILFQPQQIYIKLARAVFHMPVHLPRLIWISVQRRYRKGQEDQLGALGLMVNVIVLWNTLYMNAALEQLQGEGFPIKVEDVALLFTAGVRTHQSARAVS